jgi:hypothetical protein
MSGDDVRGSLFKDGYRISREADGRILCVRTRVHEVRHISIHSTVGFECGPGQSVAGGEDLALAILADFLRASKDPSAYENPTSDERAAWLLHRRFRARWLLPRRLEVGGAFELSAEELESWVVGEGPTLTNLG